CSSRRRHTRSKRDWSSDVCSSDLVLVFSVYLLSAAGIVVAGEEEVDGKDEDGVEDQTRGDLEDDGAVARGEGPAGDEPGHALLRSAERRVGREGRSESGNWPCR